MKVTHNLAMTFLVVVVAFVAFLSGVQGQVAVGKSVIKYLGNSFLMRDGCPPPHCNPESEECKRSHSMIRALYSNCIQSEEGQHVGCVTDKLQDGSFLTVPVYATMCSAMCYEKSPDALKSVHRCPYRGTRQHNTDLSTLF